MLEALKDDHARTVAEATQGRELMTQEFNAHRERMAQAQSAAVADLEAKVNDTDVLRKSAEDRGAELHAKVTRMESSLADSKASYLEAVQALQNEVASLEGSLKKARAELEAQVRSSRRLRVGVKRIHIQNAFVRAHRRSSACPRAPRLPRSLARRWPSYRYYRYYS